MHAEPLRSKESLLFRGDGGEVDAVWRFGLRESVSQFEEDTAAGGVVCSAVIYLIAFRIRIDAEMIVVSRVKDRLSRLRARNFGDHVGRFVAPDFAGYVSFEMYW